MCNYNNSKYKYFIFFAFMHNVFSITQKSILFFLNLFQFKDNKHKNIKHYIEIEYKPIDREWAYTKFKKN